MGGVYLGHRTVKKSYFVTATGTDVGKTLVMAALAHQLRGRGSDVRALKPVASGFDAQNPDATDTAQILKALGREVTPEALNSVTPWRFRMPLSPDMAAAAEHRPIDFASLITFCQSACDGEINLIEGVGGIMVPLNNHSTVLDWIVTLDYPVILVGGTYLGSINHTLSALEILKIRGCRVQAVILSESEKPAATPVALKESLARFIPSGTSFDYIGRLDASAEPWKQVPDLTQRII